MLRGKILSAEKRFTEKANQGPDTTLDGWGAKDLRVRILPSQVGTLVVVELLVGLPRCYGVPIVVNTMAEAVAPMLEKISKGQARLRIISNLQEGCQSHDDVSKEP